MKKIVNGKAVEVDEPGAFVTVRLSQLIAVLQCHHVADGMTDEDALTAARQGAAVMADSVASVVTGPDVKLALAALAPLFNPEPHPFQEQWSDAHSMNRSDLLTRVTEAIAVGRAEGHAAGRAEVELEWKEAEIDRGDLA